LFRSSTASTAAPSPCHSWADNEPDAFSEDVPFAETPPCRDSAVSLSSQNQASSNSTEPSEPASSKVREGATTVMVRHVACRYMADDIECMLTEKGLGGTYDSLYVPLNPSRRANLGYFFVNFHEPEHIDLCISVLQGKPLGDSNTEKLCEVSLARVQGKVGLLGRHSCGKDGYKGRPARAL